MNPQQIKIGHMSYSLLSPQLIYPFLLLLCYFRSSSTFSSYSLDLNQAHDQTISSDSPASFHLQQPILSLNAMLLKVCLKLKAPMSKRLALSKQSSFNEASLKHTFQVLLEKAFFFQKIEFIKINCSILKQMTWTIDLLQKQYSQCAILHYLSIYLSI